MCLDANCGYSIGSFLYVFERLASCCAMAAVVSCLIATLIIMLGMGIGVGYNYCFVDVKVAAMAAKNGVEEEEDERQTVTDAGETLQSVISGDTGKGVSGENDRRKFQRIFARNKTLNAAAAITASDQSLKRILGGHSFRNPGHNAKRYAIPSETSLENTNSEPISGSTSTAESTPSTTYSIEIKPTMVLPLRNVNLLSFIQKLRESNKNITLELFQ